MYSHNHNKSIKIISCLFCMLFLLAASTITADAEKRNQNHKTGAFEKGVDKERNGLITKLETDVLYYDWQTKIGIIEREGELFKVKLKHGGYECEELESYPEGFPSPNTHVQNYPDRLKRIESSLPDEPASSVD